MYFVSYNYLIIFFIGLKNLKWGNYVGSLEENTPMYIWKRKHKTLVSDFVPLLTNDVFGLSNNSALLLTYSKVIIIQILYFFIQRIVCFDCIPEFSISLFHFNILGKIVDIIKRRGYCDGRSNTILE